MLLAVDIGNTNISCAIFKGTCVLASWEIALKDYSRFILSKKILHKNIDAALIASVVPEFSRRLIKDIYKLSKIKALLIAKDIRLPIKTVYHQPKELGSDRLVNAYAASKIYKTPVIIISCGTAITIDAVSINNIHLGGFIMPGLKLCLTALNLATAQLPAITLKPPNGLLGKDTKSSILNGVIFGTSASISGLIKNISSKMKGKITLIGTGGDIRLIKKLSPEIKIIDPMLTLKGIALIYANKKTNR
ncbi:MAG: type III pantothenate kinase [Candidatus Omnitrophica bacterium]|jgi:type III pantothenate kinase|nr:type III pantothenate kinase [Candidatus Omnitrophota bacterium]